MRIVAVTGISGYLGQRLLSLLDADASVERIVGVDLAEPELVSSKLEFHPLDVRDTRLGKVFSGADTVVHLAFVLNPMRDEEQMRSINLDGTRNVLGSLEGARKLIYPSSATVYGAHADNDFPLVETSPLRANPGFSSSAHKLATEQLIAAFAEDHHDTVVTVLRPAIVFGPNVENFISRLFEAPRVMTVKGYAPPLQVVHEEDVAEALHLAVGSDLSGAYNVAADGWLDAEEVLEISGKKRVELPEAVAFSIAERAWRLGLTESPPGELDFVMHPWVVDNAKLKTAGWKPKHSNRDALLETIESHRPWVSLGRARARKADLAKGAAATLGLIATMAAARRSRRRR
jgi:nucleoside-diphosphate-sugar epimerase